MYEYTLRSYLEAVTLDKAEKQMPHTFAAEPELAIMATRTQVQREARFSLAMPTNTFQLALRRAVNKLTASQRDRMLECFGFPIKAHFKDVFPNYEAQKEKVAYTEFLTKVPY